jgi:hypothetical protein
MVNLLTRDALHIVMELIASPSYEPGANLASAYLVLNCRCAAWLHPTGPPMRLGQWSSQPRSSSQSIQWREHHYGSP